eukprot:snap_masked-scaffold_7-processed-gene-6.16-mRNA-1 protein AED:1.00 eAED:1.00 QI:0/-1/0/0/-1/1/1/0/69
MVGEIFGSVVEKKARLGVDKCVFLTRQAEFCGRVMQPEEWRGCIHQSTTRRSGIRRCYVFTIRWQRLST